MSDNISLAPVNFLAAVTASTVGGWVPVDYRYSGSQYRTVAGTYGPSVSDQIALELRLDSKDSAGNTVSVITTATTWGTSVASVTGFSAAIVSPATAVRIRKIGSSAAATVNGIV